MGSDLLSVIVSLLGTIIGLVAFYLYDNIKRKDEERERLKKEIQIREKFIQEQKKIIEEANKKKEAQAKAEDEFFKD